MLIQRYPTLATIFAALLVLTSAAQAGQAPPLSTQAAPSTQPASPQLTYVGFYINDLVELNLKQSTYTVDFYIWFRWTGNADPGNFEFLNGTLDLKEHPYRITANGMNYLSYHCRGTFHIAFDYRRYPLDEHDLILEMEDGEYEAEQLRYVIDEGNMQNLRLLSLTGWTCVQPRYEVRENYYHTNFGYPTEQTGGTSTYSRVLCTIHISRHSASVYIKTFLGMFISVGIACLAFLLKPGEADPRFAVGVAAIFAAVSSEIVAANNLPEMPYMTLADKINLFSLFVIFLSLLQSCLSLRLYKTGKIALANHTDKVSLIAFPMCYAIVVCVMTFWN